MANNYSLWSESIRLQNADEVQWMKSILKFDVSEFESNEDACAAFAEEFNIELEENSIDSWPEFEYNLSEKEGVVYLYSEGEGNFSNLVLLVQEFLSKFRQNEFFCIEWADTCSKPRAGEFGGGAAFITANDTKYMSTSDWIRQQVAEFQSSTSK